MPNNSPIRKLAIVVGGGPAPGINGVISSVTIEAINLGFEVYGIMDGFKNLVTDTFDVTSRKIVSSLSVPASALSLASSAALRPDAIT